MKVVCHSCGLETTAATTFKSLSGNRYCRDWKACDERRAKVKRKKERAA